MATVNKLTKTEYDNFDGTPKNYQTPPEEVGAWDMEKIVAKINEIIDNDPNLGDLNVNDLFVVERDSQGNIINSISLYDMQFPPNSIKIGDSNKISDLAQSIGYSTKFDEREYILLGYEITETDSKRPVVKSFSEASGFVLQPFFDVQQSFNGTVKFDITSVQQVIGKTYNLKVSSDADLNIKLFRLAENGGEDAMIVDETVPSEQTDINGFDFDLSPIVDFADNKVYRLEINANGGNAVIAGTNLTGANPYSVSVTNLNTTFVPFIERKVGWVYENKDIAYLEDITIANGVQSVTGDGVSGTVDEVVLTFPTPSEIGAKEDFAENTAFNKNFGINSGDVMEGNTVTITAQQATDIQNNNAKVGITPSQSDKLDDLSGVNTGDQDISGIAINTGNITVNSNNISANAANIAQNATDIATAVAAGLENKNDITDLEANKLDSVSTDPSINGNGASIPLSVGLSSDSNNAAIFGNDGKVYVPEIPEGILSTVFFTAEEVTTTEGTFYKTLINERGSVAQTPSPNAVQLNDNEVGSFPVEFVGEVNPIDQLILEGSYAAFPIIQIGLNSSDIRIKIEAYICDSEGVPFDCGGDVGTLGVETLLIADSGIVDIAANNPQPINCQGAVNFNTNPTTPRTFNAGERFRYVVVAEKVGTAGGSQTFTLFSGSDYNSFFKIPSTSSTIVKRSQYLVGYFASNPVSAPTVLLTQAGFTIPTGKYFGTGSSAFLKGVKFTTGVLVANQAASFKVQIRYRDKGLGIQHTAGGSDSQLLKEVELYSTSTPLGSVYNEGNEVVFDPVQLIPDKIYFVDVTDVTGFVLTNLDVELLVESEANNLNFLF